MPYCYHCGANNLPNAQFCKACGRVLTGSGKLTGRLTASALVAGRYGVERKLGEGGMGAVYLVRDMRLGGKQYALKEMSDQGILDPAERQAALDGFRQEAHMLAGLDHPNLPKVTDYFEEGGNQYLVMEYVQGETLEKRLERSGGPLPEPLVRKVADQLCDVLDYLHRRQPPIIFRDLKPANIMLQADDKVKLIDFGIARHFKPGKSKDTQAMGTPGYAAPEQYGKGQSDQRTDIYALGAVLHHMLTGQDPAQEPFHFAPVQSLQPRVSAGMNQAVQKAIALDQAQRWRSVQEMRAAMVGAGVSTPVQAVTTVTKPAPSTAPPAATNVTGGQSTPMGIPKAAPQSTPSPSTTPDIRRAHWLWFLLVAVAVGWLVAPSTIVHSSYFYYLYSFWYSLYAACILLLAYLLTHRPLTMVIVAAFALLFTIMDYGNMVVLWPLLLMAASMEVVAGVSVWRTRNLLALLVMAALGLITYHSVIVSPSGIPTNLRVMDAVNYFMPIMMQVFTMLVMGVVIAWVASNLINLFTEVGKR